MSFSLIVSVHNSGLISVLTWIFFPCLNTNYSFFHSSESDNVAEKLLSYNRANRAVAILCNHQRAPPKTFEQSMANLQAKARAA